MFRPEHNYKDFFTGAILGSTLGAAAALMFTEKGKKIQKELMHKYHDVEKYFDHFQKSAAKKLKKPAVKRVVNKLVKKAKKAKAKRR